MKTIVQLAKEHKLRPGTLSVRLWTAGIECSSYKTIRGRALKQFDAKKVAQIRAYLKMNPVRRKAGRPKKERKP